MQALNFNPEQLLSMAHSPVRNYAIPGLTSYLIGQPSLAGTVRLFHCEREHQEAITPHSHRFDFQCWVFQGKVRNRIWSEVSGTHWEGFADEYRKTPLIFRGGMGEYGFGDAKIGRYTFEDHVFEAGQCYAMKANEIHSIYFSRDAKVLFFEGPTISDTSVILEPFVDGEAIPTFKVEPWMFKREQA